MVNQQKIITMTKLALYDKHEGAADRAANDYFRHDYIYRKNMGTRISVGIGGIVILALYWLRVVLIDGIDIFELNIQSHVTETVLFIIAITAVYSVIGTVQGTREYYLVQKRLQKYQGMLRFLENTEVKKPVVTDEGVIENERRPRTRSEELRERRDRREARELRESRETRELRSVQGSSAARTLQRRTPNQNNDPLANVSAKALSGSRPRNAVPLTGRAPRTNSQTRPLVRLSNNENDSPLIRNTKPGDKPADN